MSEGKKTRIIGIVAIIVLIVLYITEVKYDWIHSDPCASYDQFGCNE